MTGSAIKRRLRAHGFWPAGWPINNGVGPLTRKQIAKFQKAHGLEASGKVGPKTTAALNAPATRKAAGERARAVNWAKSRVGITENPPGSNRGRYITAWQELAGFPGAGVAWCQTFVNASAYVGSRKRIKPIWFGGYTPGVVDMADNGEHGLKRIKLAEARPGDWVYFKFPGVSSDFCDHVGLFLHDNGDGTISTIEGNTSSGESGSQSNGGGVFRRIRPKSYVVAAVRPPFKS